MLNHTKVHHTKAETITFKTKVDQGTDLHVQDVDSEIKYCLEGVWRENCALRLHPCNWLWLAYVNLINGHINAASMCVRYFPL